MLSWFKKNNHCNCDKITPFTGPDESWFERLLTKILPHFDIVKTIQPCDACSGHGFGLYSNSQGTYEGECPACLGGTVAQPTTVLYLRRFYLFRSRWLGLNFGDIYLHHIVRSDDDQDPHDHPWGFTGLVLKGGYIDERWHWLRFREPQDGKVGVRSGPYKEMVKPGRIIRRKAEHIHRVILPKFGRTAWTLIFTSAYSRDWNFITADGPVYFRRYLGIPDNVDVGE